MTLDASAKILAKLKGDSMQQCLALSSRSQNQTLGAKHYPYDYTGNL